MIELGKSQILKKVKETDFGIYLGDDTQKVLLPKKQVPEGLKMGDELEVFVYKDSSDRLISTTAIPKIQMGQPARLTVKQMTSIGAFLDWGLEKDLLLPFKEQTKKIIAGESYLVSLYIDKSERLCATMKVYDKLTTTDKYQKDDVVEGTVYDVKDGLGAFVAVDNKFHGLIPGKEIHRDVKTGDIVYARVTNVREDGKLDLSIHKKAYMQMDDDAKNIIEIIREYGGVLPYNDKASPQVIEKDFKMSKNAFKRAVGKLLKEGKVEINDKNILLKEESQNEENY
jgi:predicted RNA-binding protein (virulence factor B family)